MTPTLLQAVARRAEAITPDADLLGRYVRERDHPAFEELVRRHGPLVWAVCRHLLPDHADAEDAFQAVFLALVRSAPRIRDGRAIPAWLHGVAVRVATRARRAFARRRARERVAALPEADRPVPDGAWEGLVAAVHEEVRRLPEAERTAFVLCDLEGVSQADAAARLGWPLGSVSGRLCKARQRLLDRLTARGIAPTAAVGVGITAGAASAVPAKLFDAVKGFPASPAAASSAASALARGLTEGVAMRVKLMTAAGVVVAALGATGGAVLLSRAAAQPPEVVKEVKDLVGGLEGQPPGKGGGPPGAGGPPGVPGMPGAPGTPGGGFGPLPGGGPSGPGGGGAGWAVVAATWEYKFVDLASDRKEFTKTIAQHGKEGWEFCSSERFGPDALVLVFKKRKAGDFGGVGAPGGPGIAGGPNWRDWVGGGAGASAGGVEARVFTLTARKAEEVAKMLLEAHPKAIKILGEPRTNVVIVVADAATMKQIAVSIQNAEKPSGEKPKPGPVPMGSGGPPTGTGYGGGPVFADPLGGMPGAGLKPAALNVFNLKHAKSEEMVVVMKKLFPNADMTADPRTNTLIVRADTGTLDELRALLARLDVEVAKPK